MYNGASVHREESTIVAILLATISLSSASPVQVDAAKGVLQRLLGERVGDFSLSIIPKEGKADVFEISAKGGKVDVKGSSGVALCRGSAATPWFGGNCSLFTLNYV
ncbi:MAG: alpha-N-acetylglucosaminidase N-terminal domain-containing protein [Verrucomicrobiota bacterium]